MAKPKDQVVRLPATRREDAIDEIRRIAQEETDKVFFLDHAAMRMKEREITNRQVLKVLRHGEPTCDPEWSSDKEKGWKCIFKRISAGECITVVAKLIEREEICCLIVTVYGDRP